MIAANMRNYNYSVLSSTEDDYGQPIEQQVEGTIKMSFYLTNQSIDTANSLYSDAQYVALTMDNNIDDTYIIDYEDKKLKVLYVNPEGIYKQVFLARM